MVTFILRSARESARTLIFFGPSEGNSGSPAQILVTFILRSAKESARTLIFLDLPRETAGALPKFWRQPGTREKLLRRELNATDRQNKYQPTRWSKARKERLLGFPTLAVDDLQLDFFLFIITLGHYESPSTRPMGKLFLFFLFSTEVNHKIRL